MLYEYITSEHLSILERESMYFKGHCYEFFHPIFMILTHPTPELILYAVVVYNIF